MSTDLMASMAIIETMLKDIEKDFASDLFDNPEVHTGVQMAHRQMYNARLRYAKSLEQGKKILAQPASIAKEVRLTREEKWMLRAMSDRPNGVSCNLVNAQHDRLIEEKFIFESNGRFHITDKGRTSLAELIKLPGAGGGVLSVQK